MHPGCTLHFHVVIRADDGRQLPGTGSSGLRQSLACSMRRKAEEGVPHMPLKEWSPKPQFSITVCRQWAFKLHLKWRCNVYTQNLVKFADAYMHTSSPFPCSSVLLPCPLQHAEAVLPDVCHHGLSLPALEFPINGTLTVPSCVCPFYAASFI